MAGLLSDEAAGAPWDLLSGEEGACALALLSEDGAAALGAGKVAALSPLPATADAPSPDDAPPAVANASGAAKSSDTKAAKRNNLLIIIPPGTLIFFF